MSFGSNLQYLRRMRDSMTQDQLAEKMDVSRQMVSKWESDEAYPEIEKIFRLCDLFSCTMDQLLREDMRGDDTALSPVRIETVERFRMARYVIISPQPENDVNHYMRRWAEQSGLLEIPGYTLKIIGWDFPFVTPEQQNGFGLRGYGAACVIPADFCPRCGGAELTWQDTNEYAVITIIDPFAQAFDRIPSAYKRIFKYLEMKGIKKKQSHDLTCFEHVYERDGVCYMDVYIAVNALTKTGEVFFQ